MEIRVPENSLIQLCGAPGCGKSTFAHRYFLPTQVVSSDRCRQMVCDDVHNMRVNKETFSLVRHIVRLRLSLGRLTVVDATSLRWVYRSEMQALAREYGFHTVLILLDMPLSRCLEQNRNRDRQVDPGVIEKYHQQLQIVKERVKGEGFDQVVLVREEDLLDVTVHLEANTTDRKG
jgi:predicted kinase